MEKDPHKMVRMGVTMPQGAIDYLRQLAIDHGCFEKKKGVRHPSVTKLFRMMAAGQIKTVLRYQAHTPDCKTYPFCRGSANKETKKETQTL